jgi:hypothetical protein
MNYLWRITYMIRAQLGLSLTETEKTKLEQAERLIREVVKSVDEYHSEDERLDAIPMDTGSASLLRLIIAALDDELKKYSFSHTEIPKFLS